MEAIDRMVEIRQDTPSGKLRFSFQSMNIDMPPVANPHVAPDCVTDSSTTIATPFAHTAESHTMGSLHIDSTYQDDHEVEHDPSLDMDADHEMPNVANPCPIVGLQPPSPPQHSQPASIRLGSEKTLLSMGIQVDPTFNLTICLFCRLPIPYLSAHPHYLSNHKPAKHSPSCIPSKEEVDRMLLELKADQQKPVAPGPITPIPGLEIFEAVKCQVPSCVCPYVFSNKRRFNEHCSEFHPNVMRVSSKVNAHKLSNMRAMQQMVEVIVTTTPPQQSLADDLEEQLSSMQLYALPEVFQPSSNERSKGTLFAQLGWDHLLIGVRIADLRRLVI